jgi:hypothetical protein
MDQIGKAIVVMGILLVAIGLVIWVLGGIPGVGRLPGDIYIRRGNFTFYFPLATSILISIVLSLLLMLMRR